jgi:hypothetical protein
MTSTVTARCTASDGWWAVEVPEVQGLFTQVRRLEEVPVVVLDAAVLLTGRPDAVVDVKLAPVFEQS